MFKIKTLSELNHNYLIIQVEDCYEIDNQIKMIKNKNIDGILKVTVQRINNTIEYIYEISNSISVENMYTDELMRFDDIRKLLSDYFNVLNICDEYMIDKSNIILLPELIFKRDNRFYFCIFTKCKNDINDSFLSLLNWMLEHVDYDDEKAVNTIYKINAKSIREGFDSNSIKKILNLKTDINTNNREELWDELTKTTEKDEENMDKHKKDNILEVKKNNYIINFKNAITFIALIILIFSICIIFGISINFKAIIGICISLSLIVYMFIKNKEKVFLIRENIKKAKSDVKNINLSEFDIFK